MFIWVWAPSAGASGGILMSVSDERFDAGECAIGKFFTRMLLIDKVNNFKWNLVNIYGAAHEKGKAVFFDKGPFIIRSINHYT
jgi:hypothetical protein